MSGSVLVDGTERPIAGAIVHLRTPNREVRTDEKGKFSVASIPVGDQDIDVRAVGFKPISFTVKVSEAKNLELDLLLAPTVTTLDTAKVHVSAGNPLHPWVVEFEERRRVGIGNFVDAKALENVAGQGWVTLLLSRVPGLRPVTYDSRRALAATRGRNSLTMTPRGDGFDRMMGAPPACYVQIIIDNVVRYKSNVDEPLFDIGTIDAASISAMEFYTVGQLPSQFNRGGNAPCGALVIWQKSY